MSGELKSYDKYYLKRDHNSGRVEVSPEGKPVLSEKIRSCRLQEQHVAILNKGWQESGIYYAESKDGKKTSDDDQELDDLRKEATELGIKSAHLMKKEKLIEKINEAKSK